MRNFMNVIKGIESRVEKETEEAEEGDDQVIETAQSHTEEERDVPEWM